jgi:hypothetical protein
MIATQIIKEGRKPLAVILDYGEYLRLREIEQDRLDYETAIKTKSANKKWTDHSDLKKMLD